MTEGTGFASWCIVELMGHVTLVGYVSETEIGGSKLLRIDVPASKGMQAFSSLFGTSAVYKMTPVDEETVTAVCERQQQQPFSSWELKQAFNDWAKVNREKLEAEITDKVRRELTHGPAEICPGFNDQGNGFCATCGAFESDHSDEHPDADPDDDRFEDEDGCLL